MDNEPLFESLCHSQERYQLLKKAQVRYLISDDRPGDLLSDLLYQHYAETGDAEELLSRLRYSISELTRAADATKGFLTQEEAVR
jgi:hypothetical protein